MSATGVLVCNSDFLILRRVDVEEAFALIATKKAWIFESVPGKFVRSPSTTFAWPVTIIRNKWVDVPYVAPKTSTVFASRMNVLKRDDWTCAYCGEYANTWDHIWPQSKGGEDTWMNTVAACRSCNSKKANLTPEQAEKIHGLKLLWPPRVPGSVTSNFEKDQARIFKLLEVEGGLADMSE